MTIILNLDLDIVKMYHHTKNEVSMSRHSKVIDQMDRHTDRQTHSVKNYLPTYLGCNYNILNVFGRFTVTITYNYWNAIQNKGKKNRYKTSAGGIPRQAIESAGFADHCNVIFWTVLYFVIIYVIYIV